MRVVKLGGSLLESSALMTCLDKVARLPGDSLVVPGGGMFAEQVRMAQQQCGFNDVVAHRMAILAMQQMALLFQGLQADFRIIDSLQNSPTWQGVGIWSPQVNELDQADIAASWDITSDSLAAWVAGCLQADELILVKSAPVPTGADLPTLQQLGIIDSAFCSFAHALSCPVRVINQASFC